MQAAQFLGDSVADVSKSSSASLGHRAPCKTPSGAPKTKGFNYIAAVVGRARAASGPILDAWGELSQGGRVAVSVAALLTLAFPGIILLMVLPWALFLGASVYWALFGRAELVSHVREAAKENVSPVLREQLSAGIPKYTQGVRVTIGSASEAILASAASLAALVISLLTQGLDKTIKASYWAALFIEFLFAVP